MRCSIHLSSEQNYGGLQALNPFQYEAGAR